MSGLEQLGDISGCKSRMESLMESEGLQKAQLMAVFTDLGDVALVVQAVAEKGRKQLWYYGFLEIIGPDEADMRDLLLVDTWMMKEDVEALEEVSLVMQDDGSCLLCSTTIKGKWR